MSSNSVPGGMFANGSTAALYHTGNEPVPQTGDSGKSADQGLLQYTLSKDCVGGARNHTVEDMGAAAGRYPARTEG
jgi:hypothetical protein